MEIENSAEININS